MRSVAVTCILAGVVGVGACSSSSDSFTAPTPLGSTAASEAKGGRGGGGGGGGQTEPIAVTAAWGVAPAGQPTGISMAAPFDGAILDNASFHAVGALGQISLDSSTGLPSGGGMLTLVHMNSLKILPSGDFARQFVVEWEDGDDTYRLHYGDPNYAHVTCTTHDVDGNCVGAVIDSLPGNFSSDVDSTILNRITGPLATLWLREGKRKGKFDVVGDFTVPFSLTIVPNP